MTAGYRTTEGNAGSIRKKKYAGADMMAMVCFGLFDMFVVLPICAYVFLVPIYLDHFYIPGRAEKTEAFIGSLESSRNVLQTGELVGTGADPFAACASASGAAVVSFADGSIDPGPDYTSVMHPFIYLARQGSTTAILHRPGCDVKVLATLAWRLSPDPGALLEGYAPGSSRQLMTFQALSYRTKVTGRMSTRSGDGKQLVRDGRDALPGGVLVRPYSEDSHTGER